MYARWKLNFFRVTKQKNRKNFVGDGKIGKWEKWGK